MSSGIIDRAECVQIISSNPVNGTADVVTVNGGKRFRNVNIASIDQRPDGSSGDISIPQAGDLMMLWHDGRDGEDPHTMFLLGSLRANKEGTNEAPEYKEKPQRGGRTIVGPGGGRMQLLRDGSVIVAASARANMLWSPTGWIQLHSSKFSMDTDGGRVEWDNDEGETTFTMKVRDKEPLIGTKEVVTIRAGKNNGVFEMHTNNAVTRVENSRIHIDKNGEIRVESGSIPLLSTETPFMPRIGPVHGSAEPQLIRAVIVLKPNGNIIISSPKWVRLGNGLVFPGPKLPAPGFLPIGYEQAVRGNSLFAMLWTFAMYCIVGPPQAPGAPLETTLLPANLPITLPGSSGATSSPIAKEIGAYLMAALQSWSWQALSKGVQIS